jgi:hypothetical protein
MFEINNASFYQYCYQDLKIQEILPSRFKIPIDNFKYKQDKHVKQDNSWKTYITKDYMDTKWKNWLKIK